MTVYAQPGQPGSEVSYAFALRELDRRRVRRPSRGSTSRTRRPVTGKVFCEVARAPPRTSSSRWTPRTPPRRPGAGPSLTERANILNKIADRIEANLEMLAVAETWDNGKPVRETLAADLPLAIDHFRYFAGAMRAQEGSLSQIDDDTVAYHFHEPLGVVGQIIPWNFPLLMAIWKLAPALAAGNCVVLKPAEQTPASILLLIDLVGDLLPAGVLNIVNGFGVEAGKPLASSNRIAQDRVHRRDDHRPADHAVRQPEPDPGHPRARRQEPQRLLRRRRRPSDDDFYDKALEGFAMFALNQGEVCTCPSRALIQSVDLRPVPARRDRAHQADQAGQPARHRHDDRRAGQQRPAREDPVLHRHRPAGGRPDPHRRRAGRPRRRPDRRLLRRSRRSSRATTRCGSSRRRSSARSCAVTSFDDYDDALKIANDTLYGLGAGVWTRDMQHAPTGGPRHPGRPGLDQLLPRLPGAAAFGGYKGSGIGRENHKMMLDHYQQTKNLLVSYSPKKLGFF